MSVRVQCTAQRYGFNLEYDAFSPYFSAFLRKFHLLALINRTKHAIPA